MHAGDALEIAGRTLRFVGVTEGDVANYHVERAHNTDRFLSLTNYAAERQRFRPTEPHITPLRGNMPIKQVPRRSGRHRLLYYRRRDEMRDPACGGRRRSTDITGSRARWPN